MAVRIEYIYAYYKDCPEATIVSWKAARKHWWMLFFGGLFFLSSFPAFLALPFGYVNQVDNPVGGIIAISTTTILSGSLLYYGLRVYPKKINKKIDNILARNRELNQIAPDNDNYDVREKKDE